MILLITLFFVSDSRKAERGGGLRAEGIADGSRTGALLSGGLSDPVGVVGAHESPEWLPCSALGGIVGVVLHSIDAPKLVGQHGVGGIALGPETRYARLFVTVAVVLPATFSERDRRCLRVSG